MEPNLEEVVLSQHLVQGPRMAAMKQRDGMASGVYIEFKGLNYINTLQHQRMGVAVELGIRYRSISTLGSARFDAEALRYGTGNRRL